MPIRKLLAALLFCSAIASAQLPDPNVYWRKNYGAFYHNDGGIHAQLYNLQGRVASLTALVYSSEGEGRNRKRADGSFTMLFDSSGRIRESWIYMRDTFPRIKIFYRDFAADEKDSTVWYAADGREPNRQWIVYDTGGVPVAIWSIFDGRITMHRRLLRQAGDTIVTEELNGKVERWYVRGKLLEIRHFELSDSPKRLVGYILHSYHDNGMLRRQARFPAGRQDLVREFDERGHLIYYRLEADTIVYHVGATISRYTFDSLGNKLTGIDSNQYSGRWSSRRYYFVYEQGRLVSRNFENGQPEWTYRYNERGDPLYENGFSATNVSYSDYDAAGNWLTKTAVMKDGTLLITERSIRYYP